MFAAVYDPLNFLAPLTIKGKLFIQTLWKEGTPWDKKLSEAHRTQVKDILHEYQGLENITIPRQCKHSAKDALHIFVDASTQAYGACAYVLTGSGTCQLLTSKPRVAPIAKESLTVPKLELMALLMGARLLHHLLKMYETPFHKYYLWSDSQVALQWV